ncbi:MAG: DMT family transporter [Alphaproteobacteria bacterium]|nr:DMT family transporter [Alphaproteobacteria bacterium]
MSLVSKDKQAMLFSLIGFSLFAVGDLFIKFLADDGYQPVEIAFFLNFFYLPYLLLLSPILGGIKATLRTEKLWLHVLRGILGVGIFIINVNAFQKLGLSLSYTLMFVAPFFAAFMSAVFLKQTIHVHRWIAIVMGFTGVLIVLRPGLEPLEPAAYAVLFGAFLIATNHLLARRIGEDEPLMAFSLFNCIIAIQVFGVLNFWDSEMKIPDQEGWMLFFIISIFHMGGSLLTSKAFSMADTVIVAPFHYVQLLWGTGFGILIFSNVPDYWTGLGALVIVSSGIYLIYREHVRNVELTTATTAHGAIDQD